MPRPDQRRLPLLVVAMAVLGLLGAVVLDGSAWRGAPAPGTVTADHAAASADPSSEAADAAGTADPAGSATDVGEAGTHPGERALFVQWNADHGRPAVPAAPAFTVLAAALVAMAGAGSYVAPSLRVVVCRLAHAHVRRRGPPALAVI